MTANREKWKYMCPLCNESVTTKHSVGVAEAHIGATHECVNCGGLLMIEADLTVSDFGAKLVRRYEELGVSVSKEEATGTFIEF